MHGGVFFALFSLSSKHMIAVPCTQLWHSHYGGEVQGGPVESDASAGRLAVPNPLAAVFYRSGCWCKCTRNLCDHLLAQALQIRLKCLAEYLLLCRSGCPWFGGNYWVFHRFCFNLFHRFLLLPQISCLAFRWWAHRLRAHREPQLKAHLIFCAIHAAELGGFKAY